MPEPVLQMLLHHQHNGQSAERVEIMYSFVHDRLVYPLHEFNQTVFKIF
jgi:hypothetical protein